MTSNMRDDEHLFFLISGFEIDCTKKNEAQFGHFFVIITNIAILH